MACNKTRAQVVTAALQRAGRGTELKSSCNEWLNDLLRSWAIRFRFPILRVTPADGTYSLAMGAQTAALPSDFGYGAEAILFGVEKTNVYEQQLDDFVQDRGFVASGTGRGRPYRCMIDKNAGVFRFNVPADQAYPFVPIYFSVPADIDTSASGDNTKPWFESGLELTEGLIGLIYQYTGDGREAGQYGKVESMLAKYNQAVAGLAGGSQRVQLSRRRFR